MSDHDTLRAAIAATGLSSRRFAAVVAWRDERTIRRWERGETVKDATRRRLEQAAKKHGIVVPKKP